MHFHDEAEHDKVADAAKTIWRQMVEIANSPCWMTTRLHPDRTMRLEVGRHTKFVGLPLLNLCY